MEARAASWPRATGATAWKPVGNLARPVVCVALDARNPSRLYAAVVHSKEGGLYAVDTARPVPVWMRLTAPPRTEGHPCDIHALQDGSLVCTFSGRRVGNNFTPSSGVFFSADGGQTWEDRTDSRMRYWCKDLVTDPADKTQSTWYVGVFFAWGKAGQTGKSGLYRTTDRGKHWTLLADSSLAPSKVLNVESCRLRSKSPRPVLLYHRVRRPVLLGRCPGGEARFQAGRFLWLQASAQGPVQSAAPAGNVGYQFWQWDQCRRNRAITACLVPRGRATGGCCRNLRCVEDCRESTLSRNGLQILLIGFDVGNARHAVT